MLTPSNRFLRLLSCLLNAENRKFHQFATHDCSQCEAGV